MAAAAIDRLNEVGTGDTLFKWTGVVMGLGDWVESGVHRAQRESRAMAATTHDSAPAQKNGIAQWLDSRLASKTCLVPVA
jgi:hypothetical protein